MITVSVFIFNTCNDVHPSEQKLGIIHAIQLQGLEDTASICLQLNHLHKDVHGYRLRILRKTDILVITIRFEVE